MFQISVTRHQLYQHLFPAFLKLATTRVPSHSRSNSNQSGPSATRPSSTPPHAPPSHSRLPKLTFSIPSLLSSTRPRTWCRRISVLSSLQMRTGRSCTNSSNSAPCSRAPSSALKPRFVRFSMRLLAMPRRADQIRSGVLLHVGY